MPVLIDTQLRISLHQKHKLSVYFAAAKNPASLYGDSPMAAPTSSKSSASFKFLRKWEIWYDGQQATFEWEKQLNQQELTWWGLRDMIEPKLYAFRPNT